MRCSNRTPVEERYRSRRNESLASLLQTLRATHQDLYSAQVKKLGGSHSPNVEPHQLSESDQLIIAADALGFFLEDGDTPSNASPIPSDEETQTTRHACGTYLPRFQLPPPTYPVFTQPSPPMSDYHWDSLGVTFCIVRPRSPTHPSAPSDPPIRTDGSFFVQNLPSNPKGPEGSRRYRSNLHPRADLVSQKPSNPGPNLRLNSNDSQGSFCVALHPKRHAIRTDSESASNAAEHQN